MSDKQKNVLGEDLEECSNDPLTGWFRDGCCNTDENDHGLHTVCVKVNNEFLEWCKKDGNDLITPHPEYGFPGLKDGDNWCVCASSYARAVDAGKGSSCHVGYRSCFYRSIPLGEIDNAREIKMNFEEKEKTFDPEKVYKGKPNPTKI